MIARRQFWQLRALAVRRASDPRSAGRADTGGASLPGSAADFAALMAAETEKWGKVVAAAEVKTE